MKMEMEIRHAAGGEEADDGAGSEPDDVNTRTTANENPQNGADAQSAALR
ncbi:uncharacterized protein ARB_02171 [Trichophyton benhamiae CBS 112371]|uniref:Uncharacterized protein n=2 Tax=Trichophyton TaxID=5550 RepID=D4B142_ARTBC|nr:uncharacterized protein ARB_02171 [Trichophyton benhamiae CBS 112371]XP_003025361.1 uncharacterized protein TRV_00422 [Trichophyton verrucosum HKI 0517]EFE30977.1 hypothetical protein ARB_02171 [Trichophyton benhamiae CBS 112371]EFE44750.1 hypothetical protein TRV_00422 [Trichophyton verrucosum HKI 0517]